MTATNSFGMGSASSSSNTLGPPDPVQNFHLTSSNCDTQGDCLFSLTWTLPTNTGGVPVKAVVIDFIPDGSNSYCGFNTANVSYVPPGTTSFNFCGQGLYGMWVQNEWGAESPKLP